MKLIIAGTRTIHLSDHFINSLIGHFKIIPEEVVCGMASGPDMYGKSWANSLEIPVKKFPADWDTHGKSAGYKRNVQMAEYATALLLIWNGKSSGSNHMREIMRDRAKKVYEVILMEST